MRETGIRGGAGAPIVVDGKLWGCMAAAPAKGEPVPPGLEQRVAEFTELVATSISNAQARSELAASRARTLSIDSPPGGGTRIAVELPVRT